MTDATSYAECDLAELVRLRRKELDLTEQDLAARCGWRNDSGSTDIRSLEAGEHRFPSKSQIEDLAQALELAPETLDRSVQTSLEKLEPMRPRPSATIELAEGRRVRHLPPAGVQDDEELRAWARELCQAHGRTVTLRLDNDQTVEISPDSTCQ